MSTSAQASSATNAITVLKNDICALRGNHLIEIKKERKERSDDRIKTLLSPLNTDGQTSVTQKDRVSSEDACVLYNTI